MISVITAGPGAAADHEDNGHNANDRGMVSEANEPPAEDDDGGDVAGPTILSKVELAKTVGE